MNLPIVRTLHTGKIEPLADTEYFSAINKQEVFNPQFVSRLGLINDVQCDLKNHGGEDKAVHQYAWEHYEIWKEFLPDCKILQKPAAFGENISSVGMTEETVCVGDRYKIGSCILEVSQARQPCWKLNYRFGYPKMSEEVQKTMRTGWYYRIIEEGTVKQGDTIKIVDRPYPDYPLKLVLEALYKDCLNKKLLEELCNIKPLATGWKTLFSWRLETGEIENWERRLFK